MELESPIFLTETHQKRMRILSIETSCDETAAAILEDGRQVLASVVASQTPVHKAYQGVVPEIASRCHIEYMLPVVAEALRVAGCEPDGSDLDAVAVTRGPGLVGSLLVGVETAKTLAWRWRKPLIAVHHTVGHLMSVFCELPEGRSRFLEVPPDDSEPASTEWGEQDREAQHGRTEQAPVARGNRSAAPAVFDFPFLGLAISGGHSSLVRVEGPTEMRLLGSTLDDAPGEAYDKVAKVLGLGYPGGPEVDRRAALGNPEAFDLPRPILHAHGYDFSFSGLKTAVVREIEERGGLRSFHEDENLLNDLCASFQAAVIDVLLRKSLRALRDEKLHRLAVVGGVACNRGLRKEAARRLKGTHLLFPAPALCTDNAAMIGAAAVHIEPLSRDAALRLDARAGWELGQV
ncbi:MAG TPA: tRNA (adenosine(37)-N6)-threonylcarbamoyltransferase complex transferase subunit TsaD [Candidatus Sumerlaeota bacterium]|nr:tRNA (adenosine(37)-N6)-threonylcarbamoyltransferase complex transferase subunit TsaD [Candidatus Sumerlaeota bacterium]